MTVEQPQLFDKPAEPPKTAAGLLSGQSPDSVTGEIEQQLEKLGWNGVTGDPGWALVRLFGRLSDLIISRLNRVPEKHFLAFLNAAGVDLLPPRAAQAEVSFTPVTPVDTEDCSEYVHVPADTKVATLQTESQPEIIFETERSVNVVPNELVACYAFDPLNFSDRTADATRYPPNQPFSAFKGTKERDRYLLIKLVGPAELLTGGITLDFTFDPPGYPGKADEGWHLKWYYSNGLPLKSWPEIDVTVNEAEPEKVTRLTTGKLPELAETEVGEEIGLWIAARLAGDTGSKRIDPPYHLPCITNLEVEPHEPEEHEAIYPDAVLSAIQSGTVILPQDPRNEFLPFGPKPVRLDTFYVRSDEVFGGPWSKAELRFSLPGISEPDEELGKAPGELDALAIKWAYYGLKDADDEEPAWHTLATSHKDGKVVDEAGNTIPEEDPPFKDDTNAFTTAGDHELIFKLPPGIRKSIVGDQEGFWLRATIVSGSYEVPVETETVAKSFFGLESELFWSFLKTYAPIVTSLQVLGQEAKSVERTIEKYGGLVDGQLSWVTSGKPFGAFFAAEEGPALYLGFNSCFPPGRWIQLLLEAEERLDVDETGADIAWEYRTGGGWQTLRSSDNSRGLSRRGYLGFFAPQDHEKSQEFAKEAYWLRARPDLPYPLANAGENQLILIDAEAEDVEVELDAQGSRARCRNFRWRRHPIADAGAAQVIVVAGETAEVNLDASQSLASTGSTYLWRSLISKSSATHQDSLQQWREQALQKSLTHADLDLLLKAVRLNTVPITNAITIVEEVIGSGSGNPDQQFALQRPPVMPGAQIVVGEPDRPLKNELDSLLSELREVDEQARVLVPAGEVVSGEDDVLDLPSGRRDVNVKNGVLLPDQETSPGEIVWVRWHQVPNFYNSKKSSRHFTLDPITGEVRFGNGIRGRMPPVGRNNIKALRYRTHNGAQGNVTAGQIAVLRNPGGPLADIKIVNNLEAAAGGSDVEKIEEVKKRGPQRIKHRQRAVTIEDYAWLAREATAEVARAWCLPVHDNQGKLRAGWVTVVIIPHEPADNPEPGPALLRTVENYLKSHALANLKSHTLANMQKPDQIVVRGPEMVTVTVEADVVPEHPELADQVELVVLNRLNDFLNPLRGGPANSGWELGRDVYLSEIYAVIESVPGVDHVAGARLISSGQQYRLRLRHELKLPYDLPEGSQVSSFDDRISLALGRPLLQQETAGAVDTLDLVGFEVGDEAELVGGGNRPIRSNLLVGAVTADSIIFYKRLDLTAEEQEELKAIRSQDGRLRLPVVEADVTDEHTQIKVRSFRVGDRDLCIVVGNRRHEDLQWLTVARSDQSDSRVFMPQGCLVQSGDHDIKIVIG